MLIPSIDLKNGRIVQLVQGRTLALASDDVDGWVERFAAYPLVQLIDLDGAMESGSNAALVASICARLPCRVGGGVRSVERAQALVAGGAREIIVSSALFDKGRLDLAFAASLADAIGIERVVGGVDSHGGRIAIRGWRETVEMTAAEAVRQIEPYCGGFLYTHIDTEGLMGGIDMDAVRTVRASTSRRISAAGGITTREEIDVLDAMGVDAVVGMAIYRGILRS
jgi:phosphoribosylformimino-5-aminoimidazole carboxamide ribotide isomerase